MQLVALAAHRMKNISSGYYKEERNQTHNKVVYVTVLGEKDQKDKDWKVEMGATNYTVTDINDGKTYLFNINKFDYIHNSLLKMDLGPQGVETIQYLGSEHDLKFDFYFCGGKVKTMVYDETQFKYKKHMAPPAKVDHSRSILSPMPGAVVEVKVVVGQTVVDGQDLCVIEAMKM